MVIGKPNSFNMNRYIQVINDFILADEVERAFWLIRNPPAYYRDNENQALKDLEKDLYKNLFCIKSYIDCEEPFKKENLNVDMPDHLRYPRFDILAEEVRKLNEQGKIPWLFDYACGTAWVPIGLEKLGLKFNYKAHTLSQKMEHFIKTDYLSSQWADKPQEGQPTIFMAFEILEHLSNEQDIKHTFLRTNIDFDYVMISTPKYTWAGGMSEWRGHALGHLRGYTPTEFVKLVMNQFPNYQITYFEHFCMMCVGRKINGQ